MASLQIQEEPEGAVCRPSYQFYPDRVEHLQASDQVGPSQTRRTGLSLQSHDPCLLRPRSHKFGKKLMYVNYLAELRDHLTYEQLVVPPDVLRYCLQL